MADANENIDELVPAVRATPEDDLARERAARALERGDRPADAVALLTERLVNLTAHEAPPLPCLCRQCIDPARIQAEEAGTSFTRDFSVARGRVLFYWVPARLGSQAQKVRRSVAQVMDEKLKPRRRR
jgi:hypothetical protein